MKNMRHCVALSQAILVLILAAFPCLAVWPPGEDLLGLYTADDGTGYTNVDVAGGNIDIYLVATGLTEPSGIAGWECSLSWTDDPSLFFGSCELVGDAVNASQIQGDFVVDLSIPLPRREDASVALAKITFLVFGVVGHVWLHPAHESSAPGFMVYRHGDDPDRLHRFRWASSGEQNPVFSFNTGFTDLVCATHWGEVKFRYR